MAHELDRQGGNLTYASATTKDCRDDDRHRIGPNASCDARAEESSAGSCAPAESTGHRKMLPRRSCGESKGFVKFKHSINPRPMTLGRRAHRAYSRGARDCSPILIDRATGGRRRRNLPFECTMRRVAAAVPRSSNLWPSGETNFMASMPSYPKPPTCGMLYNWRVEGEEASANLVNCDQVETRDVAKC